jgi:ATP-dependent DNA ligase
MAAADAFKQVNRPAKNRPEAVDRSLATALRSFRHACWMSLEGIVSKRIGSRYVGGRTRPWPKAKNPNFGTRGLSLS